MNIHKVGFIGGGNMATALIGGMKKLPVEIAVSDPAGSGAEARLMPSNVDLVKWADLVVFAVKPHIMPAVMAEVAGAARDKPCVSIAAGVTARALREALPGARVCRAMPNTPALFGQGMSVIAQGHTLETGEYAFVREMFACVGDVAEAEESLMAAVTALSGSGPAYCFVLMEAMADAGVRRGLPRQLAYRLAAQTFLGAGAMLRESGKHPGALKDDVCSPHGTTIAAVAALERSGARAAMMDAVDAAYFRAKEME